MEGIRIGDLGIIDEDGQFEFYFNVCLTADHPINRRSPRSMEPFHFDPDDVKINDNAFAPDQVIESESIQHQLLDSQLESPRSQFFPELRCP